MADFTETLINTVVLCLMLIPGIIVRKTKLSSERFPKDLSNFVLFVAQPAMLVRPYIRDFDMEILGNVILVAVLSFVCHIVFYYVSCVLKLFKFDFGTERVLMLGVIFSNCGYMGIPLIEAVFGSEAAIYATVYNIGFQFMLWSIGVSLSSKDDKKTNVWSVFKKPAVISVIIGIFIFVLPINRYIPRFAISLIDNIKALVLPLAMTVAGYHLATCFEGKKVGEALFEFFANFKVWITIIIRLLICPAVIFLLAKLLHIIFGIDIIPLAVVLICAATPAATSTNIFAERYDLNTKLSGVLVPLSTIVSVITLPLCAMIVKFI